MLYHVSEFPSFLGLNNIPLYVYTIKKIYSSVSEHLDCLYLLTIVNFPLLACLFIYLSIYFRLHGVFVAAHGLSLVAASGDSSSVWCVGFSLQWLLLLWSTGSRSAGFSSCGMRAQ